MTEGTILIQLLLIVLYLYFYASTYWYETIFINNYWYEIKFILVFA